MSLEDAIEKFCSHELISREQSENNEKLDNTEFSQGSHCSQGLESEEILSDFDTCTFDGDIFNDFFNKAQLVGLQLLADDKDWLQTRDYQRRGKKIEMLLGQYIKIWLDVMNEQQNYNKKQNSGRCAANTFIRKALEHFGH